MNPIAPRGDRARKLADYLWRRQSRLLTSLTLLAEGKSIGEVAPAVGYDSAAAFGTAFKQCLDVSPSSYASNGG